MKCRNFWTTEKYRERYIKMKKKKVYHEIQVNIDSKPSKFSEFREKFWNDKSKIKVTPPPIPKREFKPSCSYDAEDEYRGDEYADYSILTDERESSNRLNPFISSKSIGLNTTDLSATNPFRVDPFNIGNQITSDLDVELEALERANRRAEVRSAINRVSNRSAVGPVNPFVARSTESTPTAPFIIEPSPNFERQKQTPTPPPRTSVTNLSVSVTNNAPTHDPKEEPILFQPMSREESPDPELHFATSEHAQLMNGIRDDIMKSQLGSRGGAAVDDLSDEPRWSSRMCCGYNFGSNYCDGFLCRATFCPLFSYCTIVSLIGQLKNVKSCAGICCPIFAICIYLLFLLVALVIGLPSVLIINGPKVYSLMPLVAKNWINSALSLIPPFKLPFTILPTFQLTSLCCCPYFINLACLRNAVRRQFKIKGCCLSDCLAAFCCPTCSLAQVERHLVHNV